MADVDKLLKASGGCPCSECVIRREQERPRTYSAPLGGDPVYVPFESEHTSGFAKAYNGPPEPQAEPVYTHVLLPYYEFGEPVIDMAEFHTAESLIETMSIQQANGYGFKVYKLGECVFTLDPSDNSE